MAKGKTPGNPENHKLSKQARTAWQARELFLLSAPHELLQCWKYGGLPVGTTH
jgi:hypothetical protein